ncbi:MAG: class I SAM-dependent methyltransferase [Gordonia sp. (in: high G+C Gram-positive bacteria)]|uniref:class I SAM-dependent methyltransferase n=1 Tax=Gordonia sp. (in: high G+C Gram-positive bacteria) TaxID=84139 RepID=UPI0039E3EE03
MAKSDRATSFGAQSGNYETGRPDYPADSVDWLLSGLPPPPRIVDLGAGTGKLTRVVAQRFPAAALTAVDPDAEMLATLSASQPDVATAVGSAEHLPLPDGSADAVILGQAWHWVDPDAASREIGRVVTPGGLLGLIWNIRDSREEWVARMTAVMHSSDAEDLIAGGGPSVAAPFGPVETRSWEWSRPMTRERLHAMAASRSYLITAPDDERAQIVADLDALFDDLGLRGDRTIDLPYVTHAYRAIREG